MLLESVERGEWKSTGAGKKERTRDARYAKATFLRYRRLIIRLSRKDLGAIQKRALAEGLPYETLISSLLHKYAAAFFRGCRCDEDEPIVAPRVARPTHCQRSRIWCGAIRNRLLSTSGASRPFVSTQ